MSGRGTSSAMQTAAAAGTVFPVLLWYGDFTSGAVRVCTHTHDIVHGGNTFTALGALVGVEEIKETGAVEATGATFRMSGVPSEMITKALEAGYRRRQCSLYFGFLDAAAGSLIADPVEFRFLMDQMTINDSGETADVVISAESRLVDLQRARELRQTDESQKSIFAGDTFFQYVPSLQSKDLVVGGSSGGTLRSYAAVGSSSVDSTYRGELL